MERRKRRLRYFKELRRNEKFKDVFIDDILIKNVYNNISGLGLKESYVLSDLIKCFNIKQANISEDLMKIKKEIENNIYKKYRLKKYKNRYDTILLLGFTDKEEKIVKKHRELIFICPLLNDIELCKKIKNDKVILVATNDKIKQKLDEENLFSFLLDLNN